ncbi:MAG: hypothetical protein U0359_01835 [Byssovorax sp.]
MGLVPESAPERVARHKLVEELLDQAIAQGSLTLGPLRDALSRNQLKLHALGGPRELVCGDALLRADRLLARSLDGVYRGGEIYLRLLQKISSLFFGTSPGRLFVRYVALPFGAAFVLLEGLSHVVGPLVHHLAHRHLHLFSWPAFGVTGVVIFALIHSEAVRGAVLRVLRAIGALLKALFVRFPRWVAGRPLVKALLASRTVRRALRFGLKPSIPAALLVALTPLRHAGRPAAIGAAAGAFVLANLLLNSRAGALAEELALDWSSRQWHFVSRRVLPGLFHLIVDVFKALLEGLERLISRIDERLRARSGEGAISLVFKGSLAFVWFFVSYLLRIYINLLVEPQVNPIKHFPVVTVAAKILVPMSPALIQGLTASLTPLLGPVAAPGIAGPTVLLLPGFFGFLIWELKESWKLYRASRPEHLRPVSIGHHGETMGALMKPGFHSGTLPKLHGKLRRAVRKGRGSAGQLEEALREGEESVRRFVERELIALLAEATRFTSGPIHLGAVELGSNRVRVELLAPSLAGGPAAIAFEEQSGLILAGVAEPGWLPSLPERDRVIVENALCGLYQLAGVEVVREQLESLLRFGDRLPEYDISEEGLIVWPRRDYRGEVIYDLRKGPVFSPRVRGEAPAEAVKDLREEEVFFSKQKVRWTAWVDAWKAASEGEGPTPRLSAGAPLFS